MAANSRKMKVPAAKNTDVLIVGAGPAGLMMACQLARFGINFRIIDKNQSRPVYSGALIVHAASLEIFQQMGIAGKAISQGKTVKALSVVFSSKKFRFELENMGSGLSRFTSMLMLEQSKTEQLLGDFLEENGHHVERKTELTGFLQKHEGVAATLTLPDGKQETLQVGYLIAADGAQSTIRSALGVPFPGKTNPQPLCITDCRSDVDLPPGEIQFSFLNGASVGFFPISGNRWRIDATFAGSGVNDGKRTFPEVRENFSNQMGIQIDHPDWFSVFHSHRRYAKRFRVNRCFLIGDAAHVFSPVGAQGMNNGLQDAQNLAWKLAFTILGKAKAEILASYEAERKPLAERISAVTDGFFNMAASDRAFYRFARLWMLPLFLKLSFRLFSEQKVQHFLFRKISGTGIVYRKSALVEGGGHFHGPKPGSRLPFVFYEENGKRKNIQEQVNGTVFFLLIFQKNEKRGEELARVVRGFAEMVAVQFVPCHAGTKELYRRFGIKTGGWYLVRPDLYIVCRSDAMDLQRLETCLKQFLTPPIFSPI